MGQNNVKQHIDRWLRITNNNYMIQNIAIGLFIHFIMLGLISVSSASIPISTRLFNEPFTL